MKQVLKWIAIAVAGLLFVAALVVAGLFAISAFRLNRSYPVQVASVEIPTGAKAILQGARVATIYGCTSCHGIELSGRAGTWDPALGVIASPNLTGGAGSRAAGYDTVDWVRAIRHGIGADGKPLLFMPAQYYRAMSDEDLGALLAYIQSLPPVDNPLPAAKVNLMPQLRFALGEINFLAPAALIDHQTPRPAAPERGATVAYGAYLASYCAFCHGPDLSGGPMPGTPPTAPPAPNLTPAGEIQDWRFEEFLAAMRLGMTPSGHILRDEFMPYRTVYGDLSLEEWQAIWLFLQSLPPKSTVTSE